jgi:hypothetical protein
MVQKMKSSCPACGQPMIITQYTCPACHTEVSGMFQSCRFCHLDPEMQRFITVFLVQRGNIKLVEKELGISYPTVRKELQRIAAALGFSIEEEPVVISRQDKLTILDRLEKGEIDYSTAMKLLEGVEKED